MLTQNYDNLKNKAKATEYGGMVNAYEQQLAIQQIKTEYETKVVKSQPKGERERMQRIQQKLFMSLRELQSKAMQDSLNLVVLSKQDSLSKADEETQRKQTEIDMLNTDIMLKEAQLWAREAQSRVQRIIIWTGVIFVLVLIASSVTIY